MNEEKSRREKILDGAALWASYYRAFPDEFARDYLHQNLKLFQRILLILMNTSTVFVFIAARGLGKSFISAIFLCIRCVLYPGTKVCIASGTRGQSINILEKITRELIPNSPELALEISDIKMNGTNAYIEFKNTSYIKVVTAAESGRGKKGINILEGFIIGKVIKWTEEEINILKKLYPTTSNDELGIILSRPVMGIQIKASRLGIKKEFWHQLDDDYFMNIDSADKAYWLGFISADGYIVNNKELRNYELGIQLSSADMEHLKKFNKCINGNYDVSIFKKSPFKDRGYEKEYETASIRIYSKKMVDSLEKHGVVQNKTYTLEFPKNLGEYTWDYVRGFFDGDGSVGEIHAGKNNNLYLRASFTAHRKEFLDDLNSFLNENGIYGRINKDRDWYRLDIRSKDSTKKFFENIYRDEHCVCLDRKKEKYENILIKLLPAC